MIKHFRNESAESSFLTQFLEISPGTGYKITKFVQLNVSKSTKERIIE